MAELLCLVLFVYFTSVSTAQTTDCLRLKEKCINAANGCESVWNVIEDVCNISGNRCKAEDAIGCNRIIQVLADEYPEFKNCVCTSDDFCSITILLGKQCSIDKGDSSVMYGVSPSFPVGGQGGPLMVVNMAKELVSRRKDSIERIVRHLYHPRRPFAVLFATGFAYPTLAFLVISALAVSVAYLETSSRSDTELSFRQHRNPTDQGHQEELENDCSMAKQRCQEDSYCFSVYKSFQRACQADTAKCMLPMVSQACLSVWRELRKTVLGECKCSEPLQMRCVKIWNEIFNNRCLQYSQESQALAASENYDDDDDDDDDGGDDSYDDDDVDNGKNQDTDTDNISTETKLQWSLSALSKQAYTENSTCLDVNKECVEDEACNKQLSLYLKACSVNKCNMEECQGALRFFYENMPFEVAQMMIFCDCTQPDESCHRAKELLHGKPCAVTAAPPPSCLNVIHMCEENELCRKKYTAFLSKCWRHVTKKCYNDEACLGTLIKDDMPCSANADCKAAYISNWGTMLRVECTCQNLPAAEHSLCELFHHMLHSKSCFNELRQISIKKKGFHWVNTEMRGEKLSRAQLHSSSINGETVYIIAYSSCIVLILGIVLLTLLKIRACRTKHESRSPSPEHSSETFMVHYKSHR